MKKLFFSIFCSLTFSFGFARTCIPQKLEAHFSNSDFVGEVEILKKNKNIGKYALEIGVNSFKKRM